MADDAKLKDRLAKVDVLTDLILDDLVTVARSGAMSSADRKLILDFLRAQGLNLDPNAAPAELRDMITSKVSFDDSDEPNLRIAR